MKKIILIILMFLFGCSTQYQNVSNKNNSKTSIYYTENSNSLYQKRLQNNTFFINIESYGNINSNISSWRNRFNMIEFNYLNTYPYFYNQWNNVNFLYLNNCNLYNPYQIYYRPCSNWNYNQFHWYYRNNIFNLTYFNHHYRNSLYRYNSRQRVNHRNHRVRNRSNSYRQRVNHRNHRVRNRSNSYRQRVNHRNQNNTRTTRNRNNTRSTRTTRNRNNTRSTRTTKTMVKQFYFLNYN